MSAKDSDLSESTPKVGASIPRELIDALPEEKRQELLEAFEQQVIHIRSEEHYVGPVVHPDIAARWENILPGSAKDLFEVSMQREITGMARQDRILDLADELLKHRIIVETEAQKDSTKRDLTIIESFAGRERRGQWFAFLAMLSVTLLAFLMVNLGHDTAGLAIIIAEAAGVAGIFVHQLRSDRNRLPRTEN